MWKSGKLERKGHRSGKEDLSGNQGIRNGTEIILDGNQEGWNGMDTARGRNIYLEIRESGTEWESFYMEIRKTGTERDRGSVPDFLSSTFNESKFLS